MRRLTCSIVGMLAGASLVVASAAEAGDPPETPAALRQVFARIGVQPTREDRSFTIPAAAMEPTLRCATGGPGCSGESGDKILARAYAPGQGAIAR